MAAPPEDSRRVGDQIQPMGFFTIVYFNLTNSSFRLPIFKMIRFTVCWIVSS